MKKYYCKEKNCHNEISEWNYHYGMNFCGSCARSGKRNHFSKDKYLGEDNGNYKHGKYGHNNDCVDCGKKIWFGFKRCKSCARIEEYKNPENHPQYIDGRSKEPYTFEFNTVLKELIRNRDGYTCQNCGMTEEEHLIVIGTNLHIHHIDYNKQNCNKENLITLCLSCNSRANMNRSYWQEVYTNKILK